LVNLSCRISENASTDTKTSLIFDGASLYDPDGNEIQIAVINGSVTVSGNDIVPHQEQEISILLKLDGKKRVDGTITLIR
jgi:hypothetical protein